MQNKFYNHLSFNESNHLTLLFYFQVYRYSFLARYAAINILTGAKVDIIPSGIEAGEAFLQNFVWGPSGTSLAFVYLNNIYYQDALTSSPRQITTSGRLNVIYHGIPDWVYEGSYLKICFNIVLIGRTCKDMQEVFIQKLDIHGYQQKRVI